MSDSDETEDLDFFQSDVDFKALDPKTPLKLQRRMSFDPDIAQKQRGKPIGLQKDINTGQDYAIDPLTGNIIDGTEDMPLPSYLLEKLETSIQIDEPAHADHTLKAMFGDVMNLNTKLILTWKNLDFTIPLKKKEKKQILFGINGQARPGEMIAILGGSGAGKTTLLNLLAGRVSKGSIKGDIYINGKHREANWKRIVGYVEQDDIMYTTLTVRETITFAALLRLPRTLSQHQKKEKAEQVIQELGLSECADTVIGDALARGISGGERKRTAIGIELVTDPRLLFLDEPTSGLDANTAFHLIETIGQLVMKEETSVLMTIHQPRDDILYLFDKILLLSEGKTVFFGPTQVALDYFQTLGFNCPRFMNPADFFLDIITIDPRTSESEEKSRERVGHLQTTWKDAENMEKERRALMPADDSKTFQRRLCGITVNEEMEETTLSSISGKKKSTWNRNNFWIMEFIVLFKRNMIDQARNRMLIYATIIQTFFLFLLLGFTFFQLGFQQQDIQSRVGVLFFVAVNLIFATVQPLLTMLPIERLVILRERYGGSYRISSFYLAKIISIIPLRLIITIIYALSLYYVIGFNPLADRYFIFMTIAIVMSLVAQGLGMFIGSVAPSVILAQILGPLIILIFFIFGGNLSNSNTIPAVLRWLQYISPIYYGYMSYFQNEFAGLQFNCFNNQPPVNNTCSPGFATGDQVIQQYGMDKLAIYTNLFILLGLYVGFNIFGYIGLRFTTKPKMKLL